MIELFDVATVASLLATLGVIFSLCIASYLQLVHDEDIPFRYTGFFLMMAFSQSLAASPSIVNGPALVIIQVAGYAIILAAELGVAYWLVNSSEFKISEIEP